MPSSTTPRDNARQQQDRLRAQGLRPVEFSLPDTRSATFRAEARRQSELLSSSALAAEAQAFVDEISEWPGR